MALAQPLVLDDEQIQRYHDDGYLVIEGLLNRSEIDEMAQTFDVLHAKGSIPGCFTIGSSEEIARDPLQLYPRMMHPHRIDPIALRFMLHPAIMNVLTDLLAEEPIAAQSMFYWKSGDNCDPIRHPKSSCIPYNQPVGGTIFRILPKQ